MDTNRLGTCASVVLGGLGAIALCVGIHMARKAKKAISNVNQTIDDLADKTSVEVSELVIKKAAEKAANRAADEAIEIVRKDINLKVCNAVTSAYENVEDDVRTQLSKAVDRDVDMEELKKSIVSKASATIVSKFMSNLEDYVGPITAGIVNACKEKGEAKNEA